jgi:signal transduction histidine kinase
MTSLTPWAGEVRALVARPVARRRVEGLHRFTAPTRGPWFWLALWLAVAAVSVGAFVPALFDRGPPMQTNDVLHALSGTSFAACGLIAWRRRRDSAVGPLLTLAGFGVLVPEVLAQLNSPLAFTSVLLFGELWIIVYVTLILSFATGGRLTSTVDLLIVETFFVGLFVMQFALLLFLPIEGNLLLAWSDPRTAEAINEVQFGALAVAALAVAMLTAQRWREASRPVRRALLPSLAGSLSALLYAVNLTTLIADSPSTLLMSMLNAALLAVPAALLWGLLRSRLARGGLPDLFRELGTLRGPRLEAGLAATLGDPELVLAYRVPDQAAYIDGAGKLVELPRPGSGRTAAPIKRDGRELGVLVYDAALDDDPELVGAVAATAAIALDDARLQAESAERLAELRASRERLVTAGDAERRRLERNLHDGAQQRLVSVALQLRMIQHHVHDDPALVERLAKSAAKELSQSLEELRELARGLHPAVLNHGLKAALGSLASRATVPTTVSFAAGPERLPEPVELAAYFVACEALANVGKYAQATHASIRVTRRNGVAVIEIADDGVGGADESAGSGLLGLADRLAALDGTLRVVSPSGEGTVVTAEVPCAS